MRMGTLDYIWNKLKEYENDIKFEVRYVGVDTIKVEVSLDKEDFKLHIVDYIGGAGYETNGNNR